MINLNIIKSHLDNPTFYLSLITMLSSSLIYKIRNPKVITKEIIKEIIIEKEVIKKVSDPIKKRSKVNNPEEFRFKIDKDLALNFEDYCSNNDTSRPKLIESLIIEFLSNNKQIEIINKSIEENSNIEEFKNLNNENIKESE